MMRDDDDMMMNDDDEMMRARFRDFEILRSGSPENRKSSLKLRILLSPDFFIKLAIKLKEFLSN